MWSGERREKGEEGLDVSQGFWGALYSNAQRILTVLFNLTAKHEAVFDLGSSGLAALMTWAFFVGCILGTDNYMYFILFLIYKHYLIIRHFW
jgi:hypothetical protein